jgi:hypothetical protein
MLPHIWTNHPEQWSALNVVQSYSDDERSFKIVCCIYLVQIMIASTIGIQELRPCRP